MLLIVTNTTQNCTAQIITQKFVLHMNTAVSEVTDIHEMLSNTVSKFQVMNFLYITLLTPRFFKLPQGF
jgi:myosin-crossreactive antigen